MIIVIGTVQSTPDDLVVLLTLGLEHVRRSRLEPGCLHHEVSQDVRDPRRLVFVEKWADLDALRVHFGVPESGRFVQRCRELSVDDPTIEIYDATPTRP